MDPVHKISADLLPLATPLADLKPLPGNPRRGDINAVARSYDRFGQRKPVVAQPDGTIIAGNHQYAAAIQLGWTHLAVTRVDDDDATAKAFALADNRTADLGTYDDADLAALLAAVADVDPTLVLDAGYTAEDVAGILDDEIPDSADNPPDTDEGYSAQFGVIVVCTSEQEQSQVYTDLADSYSNVRVVTV